MSPWSFGEGIRKKEAEEEKETPHSGEITDTTATCLRGFTEPVITRSLGSVQGCREQPISVLSFTGGLIQQADWTDKSTTIGDLSSGGHCKEPGQQKLTVGLMCQDLALFHFLL